MVIEMLLKLQKHFERYIITKQASKLILKLIRSSDLPKEVMLEVYRNNVFSRLISSLKDIYPLSNSALGNEFFEQLAKEFIKKDLAILSSNNKNGENLADFFLSYNHVHKIDYLSDLARFEWLVHESSNAAEDYPLLLCMLDGINENDIDLELRASVRIFHSNYPIDKIYNRKINLKEAKETGQEVYSLVVRNNFRIELFTLAAIEYHFLLLFIQKVTLDMIIIALLEKFNITEDIVTQIIERLLSLGIFKVK
ncbi:hypothetical protein NF27_EY00170 [Candidatus Jidaibacter acanthamoeba]|uniref:Putative DNA-binding domain-containing protein n=2 Tax=Candidatus Jidaibacter acanthamoebae TaxID=86105 RepID=A0A0C1MYD4_9RICK|nr:hypothetical protein NF27_EY00170 [Candidatus Jidaibacter acanthamoeba]